MRKVSSNSCNQVWLAAVLACIAGLGSPLWARSEQAGAAPTPRTIPPDHQTARFLKQAARDYDLQAALGEIGTRKAQNPQLQSFSTQVQHDFLQANQQLAPLAQEYGVSLDQRLQHGDKELTKFENEPPGSKFDQDLATEFLRSQQKALGQFETAATQVPAPDVRPYAQTMVPQWRNHLDRAVTVAQAVGVNQATISDIMNRTPAAVGGTGTAQEPGPVTGAGHKNEKGAGAQQLEQGTTPHTP